METLVNELPHTVTLASALIENKQHAKNHMQKMDFEKKCIETRVSMT